MALQPRRGGRVAWDAYTRRHAAALRRSPPRRPAEARMTEAYKGWETNQMLMDEYDHDELRASLRRAFIDNGADYIVVDSNPSGQRFLYAAIELGLKERLIYHDETAQGQQHAVYTYRPLAKLFRDLGGVTPREAHVREALNARFAAHPPSDLESRGTVEDAALAQVTGDGRQTTAAIEWLAAWEPIKEDIVAIVDVLGGQLLRNEPDEAVAGAVIAAVKARMIARLAARTSCSSHDDREESTNDRSAACARDRRDTQR